MTCSPCEEAFHLFLDCSPPLVDAMAAAALQEVQNQLLQSNEQVRLLGQELGAANQKLTYLENERATTNHKLT